MKYQRESERERDDKLKWGARNWEAWSRNSHAIFKDFNVYAILMFVFLSFKLLDIVQCSLEITSIVLTFD